MSERSRSGSRAAPNPIRRQLRWYSWCVAIQIRWPGWTRSREGRAIRPKTRDGFKVQRSKATALRSRRLGEIGEALADELLKRNNFSNVENLNIEKRNFPFADFFAERDGIRYVISV